MLVDFYASGPHDVQWSQLSQWVCLLFVLGCWLHVGGINEKWPFAGWMCCFVLIRVFLFFPLCFHLMQGNHSKNMEMLRIRLFRMMRKSRNRRKEVLLFWRRWNNTLRKGQFSQYFLACFLFQASIGTGVCWCFCFLKMDVTQQDLEFLANSFWKGYSSKTCLVFNVG